LLVLFVCWRQFSNSEKFVHVVKLYPKAFLAAPMPSGISSGIRRKRASTAAKSQNIHATCVTFTQPGSNGG
jgi:hypothetical protein